MTKTVNVLSVKFTMILKENIPLNDETPHRLKLLVDKIKKDGKGKKYDCIVGVSGGRDSTYTLIMQSNLV